MKAIEHEIFWETKNPEARSGGAKVESNETADVIIVGGGMAGLAAANRLVDAGKRVILVEKDYVGAGASGKSSGMISQDSELELSDLIENLGKERAEQLWDFVGASMERMRDNIHTHNIDCDYQEQDYVFVSNNKRSMKKVYREFESRNSLGYESRVYTKKDIHELVGSNGYEGALRYPGTYGINSYLYAQGMKQVLLGKGASVYEHSEVTSVGNGKVVANGFTLEAPHVFICVDRFLPSLHRLPLSVYHVETYIAMSQPLTDEEIKKIFPTGNLLVCDSDIIYQYYRVTGDNRLLIGGGDFLTSYAPQVSKHPEHILPKLTKYLKKKFPQVSITPEYIWPGMLGVSKDLVPIAGQDKTDPTLYYVAGATGLAWAAGLGDYLAEKVLEGRNDYDELFDPYRKFPFDPVLKTVQPVISTLMAFGISHAFVKYLRQIF